ncbi:MAG: hypothetical protein K2N13_04330 [Paraprevotella sp.]|nr:hypothetical protein [Paraprevotella sp.]
MGRIKTAIGITAIGIAVGLNLRHAFLNYGITSDSWVLKAMATDSIPPKNMHECEDAGQKKYCNSREVAKPGFALCDHFYTKIYGKTPVVSHGKIIGTEDLLLGVVEFYDSRGWIYETPDYSYLYATDFEIETGHVAGKILKSEPIRMEYHYEQVFIAAESNDCVFNSGGSCIPDADLDTACQAAYGNGLLGAS